MVVQVMPAHPLVVAAAYESPTYDTCAGVRACGFKSVVADVLWFQLLQQSSLIEKYAGPRAILAHANTITHFDPHFNVVYRYAANIALPTIASGVPDPLVFKALRALLHKSLASRCNVDDWRLHFQLSFAYYHGEKNIKEAQFCANRACAVVPDAALLKRHRKPVSAYVVAWRDYLNRFK